jgi:thiol:disulfide interchange protein DsbA
VIEPILKDLLKRKMIQLIMVDVPFNSNTPLYAKYYLYAVNGKADPDQALRVKNTLFHTAQGSDRVNSPDKLEKIFRDKGISFYPYEAKPVLNRYNELIREDNIDTTPTCVIYRNGKKEKFTGGGDIIDALKRLQKTK